MSHRSKLYGMYEDEGEFETIMSMSKADKMLTDLGYEKVFRDGVNAIWEGWRKKTKHTYSEEVIGITFFSVRGMVTIDTISVENGGATIHEGTGLSFEEIKAINEKCKELGRL